MFWGHTVWDPPAPGPTGSCCGWSHSEGSAPLGGYQDPTSLEAAPCSVIPTPTLCPGPEVTGPETEDVWLRWTKQAFSSHSWDGRGSNPSLHVALSVMKGLLGIHFPIMYTEEQRRIKNRQGDGGRGQRGSSVAFQAPGSVLRDQTLFLLLGLKKHFLTVRRDFLFFPLELAWAGLHSTSPDPSRPLAPDSLAHGAHGATGIRVSVRPPTHVDRLGARLLSRLPTQPSVGGVCVSEAALGQEGRASRNLTLQGPPTSEGTHRPISGAACPWET